MNFVPHVKEVIYSTPTTDQHINAILSFQERRTMRSSLDSFKQASNKALSKAQLMVGLNQDDGNDGVELSSPHNDAEVPTTRTSSFRGLFGRGSGEDSSMDNSEQSSTFAADAADLLCPELTFKQRLIGFGSCFGIACE